MSYPVIEDELLKWMWGTREQESNQDYNAYNSDSGASGAYQFIDSTWDGFGGYQSARDAPPHVQDEAARQLASTYYREFGSWYLVAIAWHAGPGNARKYVKGTFDPNISDKNEQGVGKYTLDYAADAVRLMGGEIPRNELLLNTPAGAGMVDEFMGRLGDLAGYAPPMDTRPPSLAGFGPPENVGMGRFDSAAIPNLHRTTFYPQYAPGPVQMPAPTYGSQSSGFSGPRPQPFVDPAAGAQAEYGRRAADPYGGYGSYDSTLAYINSLPMVPQPTAPQMPTLTPAQIASLSNYGPTTPQGSPYVPPRPMSYEEQLAYINSLPADTSTPSSVYDPLGLGVTQTGLGVTTGDTTGSTAGAMAGATTDTNTGQIYYTPNGAVTGFDGTRPIPMPTGTDATLLPGGEVLKDGDITVIRYPIIEGVYIEYQITDPAMLEANGYSLADAVDYYVPEGQLVDYQSAGNVAAIAGIAMDGYQSWGEVVEEFMGQYYSAHDPARYDPEVIAIFAEIFSSGIWATEGIDLAAYIESQLLNTDYYQSLTLVAAEYNSLTLAEQRARVETQAAIVAEEFWNLTGNRLSITDDRVVEMATAVASGARTLSAVYQEIRDIALQDPESPLSRSIRTEEINQGAFGNSVENTAQQYRNESQEWGVQLDDDTINTWATDVMMGAASDADWQEYVKDVAETLYTWKNRDTKTSIAAQPYLSSYTNLMEVSGDLNTDIIRNFLQGGEAGVKPSLQEFEEQLRRLPEWKQTANAQQTYENVAGSIGRTMGFM